MTASGTIFSNTTGFVHLFNIKKPEQYFVQEGRNYFEEKIQRVACGFCCEINDLKKKKHINI